jgi:DNA sulfur modification protein DndE
MAMGSIRLSKKSVDQLAQLTRHTGIAHRNVLCRWAFAVSWQKGPASPLKGEVFDVAIDWMTFAGGQSALIEAVLLMHRSAEYRDAISDVVEAHVARGLGELAAAVSVSAQTVKVPKVTGHDQFEELRICGELAKLLPRALI